MSNATTISITFPRNITASALAASRTEKVYLWIDWETGKVDFSSKHQSEWGNTTFHEYHGHSTRFEVSGDKVRALRAWFKENVAPLVAEVVAGYRSEWNGSNNVARFSEDAQVSLQRIRDLFELRRERLLEDRVI